MSVRIQLRRDTAANWTATNPTLTQGEPGYETDTGKIKYGDGTTAWNSLAYAPAAAIVDGTIVNADVSASAAIAGTKISPDFGSQNRTSTGTSTAASFIPTSSTAPTNGLYLSAANSVALSTNGTGRLFVDASGNVGIGSTAAARLQVQHNQAGFSYFDYYNTTTGGSIVWRMIVRNIADTGNTSVDLAKFTGAGFAIINNDTNALNYTAFNVGVSERLRITSTGNVGIGTSSPGSVLDVRLSDSSTTIGGSTSVIRVNNGSGTLNATSGIEFFHGNDTSSNTARLAGIYGLYKNFNGSGLGGDLVFATNTPGDSTIDERLRIDSSGRVGIGTTSPQATLHVRPATNSNLYVDGNAPSGGLRLSSVNDAGSANASITLQASGHIFVDSGNERARIDSSGRLLVGTSTARANFTSGTRTSSFQVEGTTLNNSAISILRNSNDTGQSAIYLAKSRSTVVGDATPDIVADGDSLGSIFFQGADNTNFVNSSSITAQIDGTNISSTSMPGRLVFSTTADGAASPTERLRITSAGVLQVADAGNIAVGTTTGTKIGTATTQKLGFFNKTPVVQPAAVADATDAASVITQLNALLARMRDLGLIAT